MSIYSYCDFQGISISLFIFVLISHTIRTMNIARSHIITSSLICRITNQYITEMYIFHLIMIIETVVSLFHLLYIPNVAQTLFSDWFITNGCKLLFSYCLECRKHCYSYIWVLFWIDSQWILLFSLSLLFSLFTS